METPGFLDYVRSLPELRRKRFDEAHLHWDTGVTSEMRESSYRVIEYLKGVLLDLANFFPPNHFEPNPRAYFDEYVTSCFSSAYERLERDRSGTAGTILLVQAGGEVIEDLRKMIAGMVRSLTSEEYDFDYDLWLEDWYKD
jgi:hypothetical protein